MQSEHHQRSGPRDENGGTRSQERPRKILVVDDDEGLAALFEAVLEDAGYDVEAVYSGADAVERVATFRPDLILLDIRMPGMDGIETFREILHRTNDSRIIFMTGYAETPVQLARPGGALDRLPHDIEAHRLVSDWLSDGPRDAFLILPQDRILAGHLAEALEAAGKSALRAEDPHRAIFLFDESPGCLVILEEPLRDLPPLLVRELSPGILRLLLSHAAISSSHPTLPPNPFLAKPFRPDELLDTVLRALPAPLPPQNPLR